MTPRWAWVLLLAALTSPFWDLGHPLWEVDDARYAEVPLEMAASGDWTTPTLNHLHYIEKPPLWYWLCALSYKIFGVGEAAAHLPLALLSLLGVLGTLWLGSWLFSTKTGLTGAAALSTGGLYFILSHNITLDLGLTVFLLWSTALVLRALSKPRDAWWAAPMAWCAVALAFLCKGLIAALFPFGWTVLCLFLYPTLRKNWRGLLHPAGPLLLFVIVAPWFAMMEDRHPGFLRVFFIEQHFQRFLTPKYNRPSPWYFFPLVLSVGLLPWTPPALGGLLKSLLNLRRDWKGGSLAVWTVMIILFFSLSQSKLAAYILPVFPHMSLLAARHLEGPIAPWTKRLSWILGIILALALPAGLGLSGKFAAEAPGGLIAAVALIIAALAAALLKYGRRVGDRSPAWPRPPWPALAAAGLVVGALALVSARLSLDRISAEPVARAINAAYRPGDRIFSYGTYPHGVPFYTRRPVEKMVNWVGELHYAKRDPRAAARFGDDDAIRELRLEGSGVFIVLRRFEKSYFLTLVRPETLVGFKDYGRWTLAEIRAPRS